MKTCGNLFISKIVECLGRSSEAKDRKDPNSQKKYKAKCDQLTVSPTDTQSGSGIARLKNQIYCIFLDFTQLILSKGAAPMKETDKLSQTLELNLNNSLPVSSFVCPNQSHPCVVLITRYLIHANQSYVQLPQQVRLCILANQSESYSIFLSASVRDSASATEWTREMLLYSSKPKTGQIHRQGCND